MKLKRIFAANIREGMRRVREELGPDAVILSNRRLEDGIEIVAATDYDERAYAGMARAAAAAEAAPPAPSTPSPPVAAKAPAAARSEPVPPPAEVQAALPPAPPVPPPAAPAGGRANGAAGRVSWPQDPMLVRMQQEISALRELLEQQMASIAWGQGARRQPVRMKLLERLLHLGLDAELCFALTEAAAAETEPERAWRAALARLAAGLASTGDDILGGGGVVALVGPTGVGKTTTVAKLAARYTLRHGPRRVAMITTDSYRIGAYDQLRTFGMILDVPVRVVADAVELRGALADFADRALVLIDTAGMSQRDLRLSQQLAVLQTVPAVRSYLVTAANAQAGAIDEAVAAFAPAALAGAILTKVDETGRLGGVLSVLYNRRLPLAYVADGQRVPEDLQPASVEGLLRRAEELAAADGGGAVSEEALMLTFGRRVAHACV
ncbi:flagellar biosynthesis protein FlhF [Plasticicumulans lactativorans]|uniref:Flagellar biosynthesis protein FlhF n=1 Tax=Plasticicumulans lactativorans TaxID=1133106 RepID=A0A4R2KYE8_9GAMM|nr:flagellar biosynthesis protein FlhF [Plasticicumulans lactativorans]TCO79681.1 flagellar biosynthesis protein FlhF [Plasticicumulans lactativorans]